MLIFLEVEGLFFAYINTVFIAASACAWYVVLCCDVVTLIVSNTIRNPLKWALAARRIALNALTLYASPAYTSVRGLPEHPDDLFRHDLLSLPPRINGLIRWSLVRGKTQWQRELPVRMLANSPELLVRMASTGIGIGASTAAIAQPYLQRGELVRVLPEWASPQVAAWAVFPGRRLMPAKTRVFIEALGALDTAAAPGSSDSAALL